MGDALGDKRHGNGKVTLTGGEVWDGVFSDDKFDEGMATNMKVNGGWMFTGQVVGGQLNGPGKITFADGGELRGNFVNGKLVEGTATDYKHSNGDNTYIFGGDNAYIFGGDNSVMLRNRPPPNTPTRVESTVVQKMELASNPSLNSCYMALFMPVWRTASMSTVN